jgi:hypothetical protein
MPRARSALPSSLSCGVATCHCLSRPSRLPESFPLLTPAFTSTRKLFQTSCGG